MKLASLCWLCCCCHHALYVFRKNANITPQPETRMGKIFANYRCVIERKSYYIMNKYKLLFFLLYVHIAFSHQHNNKNNIYFLFPLSMSMKMKIPFQSLRMGLSIANADGCRSLQIQRTRCTFKWCPSSSTDCA